MIDRKFIKATVLTAIIIFSCGALFGYSVHPIPEPEIIEIPVDVLVEVPIYVNTTVVEYLGHTVTYSSYLFTDMNETLFDYYWNLTYVDMADRHEYQFTNDSFFYAISVNVGRVNGSYPTVQFTLPTQVGSEHPNVTTDRIAVVTYGYDVNGSLGFAESYNFYNATHDRLRVNSTKAVLFARYGRSPDLDAILLWYGLAWFTVKVIQ